MPKVELQQNATEKPEPGIIKAIKKIPVGLWLFFLITVVFLLYVGLSTTDVLNIRCVNTTLEPDKQKAFNCDTAWLSSGQITQSIDKSKLPSGIETVQKYNFYDNVPKAGAPGWLLILYGIITFLFLIYLSTQEKEDSLLDIDECRYKMKERWGAWKERGLVKGDMYFYNPYSNSSVMNPKHKLRTITRAGSVTKWYVYPVWVLGEQDAWEQQVITQDAYTGHFISQATLREPFDYRTVSKRYPDLEYKTDEDLEKAIGIASRFNQKK